MTIEPTIAERGYQYKHGDRPLEGYTIQRAAGRGGFGEVYYALSDSGREVALKVVHTYEQIELRGISQCMNLKSPHLVTIFDVKYGDDGRPWVVMEFVSGPSLAGLIAAAPSGLGAAKAAFFLREIGKGLTYLHDCGIVHRDLKPGNIFYENGYVKIGDYGLSKTMSVTRHSGQTVAVGTLHYMAPEIGDGRYDRSIDIYALGALLYEMLTGQVPFYGSSPAEVLMKHLTTQVNVDNVEEPFRSVIRKAMAKNPADRFQNVQEMVEAIFGSESVRNSVSQISAASLTMVAGQVAGGIRSGPIPPPRSKSRPQDPWGEFGQRISDVFENVAVKLNEAGDRIAEKFDKKKNIAAPVSTGNWCRTTDNISTPARIVLGMMILFLAAFIALSNADPRHSAETFGFVLLASVGAMNGAIFAWKLIAPSISGEAKWFRCLAVGLPAAFGAGILCLPFWLNSRGFKNDMEATFIALALVPWSKCLATDRRDRFSIGRLVVAGIIALIISGMFDADQSRVVPIVVGASLAASLFAPWDRNRRSPLPPLEPLNKNPQATPASPPPPPPAENVNPSDLPPPIPPIPPIPPADIFTDTFDRARFTRRQRKPAGIVFACVCGFLVLTAVSGAVIKPFVPFLFIAGVFLIVRQYSGRTRMSSFNPSSSTIYPESRITLRGIALGIVRFALSAAGGLLLFVSLLLAIAVTSNLPGLFASGSLDKNLPSQIAVATGTGEWPEMFKEAGAVACVVIGATAMFLLLPARRAGGGFHMLRGILGTVILFAAAVSLGRALPDWSSFVLRPTPADTFHWYFQHINAHKVLPAIIIASVGYVFLLWPPRRHFPQMAAARGVETADKRG
jgi:serine/threonine protein kinase